MNKILLAYDGAAEAEAALTVAAELATRLDAAVGVVSVVSVHPGRNGGDPWEDASVHLQELHQVRDRLAAPGSRAGLHRATGDPAAEIERTAAEHGYDTIVVGSRGLATIGRHVVRVGRGRAEWREPRVELLWFQECPNHPAARAMLREALDEHAPGTTLDDIDATDPTIAERYRFPGSPTIRVDGRDVDASFQDPGDYTPRCRLYWTAEGLRGLPERGWVEAALRSSVERGRAVT